MGGGDPTDRRVSDLTDRLRPTTDHPTEDQLAGLVVDQLARQRSRTRMLAQRDVEAASFGGTLLDLAEADVVVSIRTATGHQFVGTIRTLSEDHLSIAGPGRPRTLVALHALVAVSVAQQRSGGARGDRLIRGETLIDAMAWLAGERPRVSIGVVGPGELLTGRLWSCGGDVCTLRTDATEGRWIHVRTAAISEVMLLDQ